MGKLIFHYLPNLYVDESEAGSASLHIGSHCKTYFMSFIGTVAGLESGSGVACPRTSYLLSPNLQESASLENAGMKPDRRMRFSAPRDERSGGWNSLAFNFVVEILECMFSL
jgi:hypothetical protein